MWVEALDLMMARLAGSGIDLSRLAAVSGSAQQHGSVYLNAAMGDECSRDSRRTVRSPTRSAASFPAKSRLSGWTRARPRNVRRSPPPSVGQECSPSGRARARSSDLPVRRSGGSPSSHRMPTTRQTRVHLVSSFLASMLAGADAPVDPGDGSGMNLMDLDRHASGGPRRLTRPRSGSRRSCRGSLPLAQSLVRCRRTGRHATDCRPHGDRVVGRQPVQSDRHWSRQGRTRRGLIGHERHGLRSHARTTGGLHRHRPCLWRADRRLHGADVFSERLSGARAASRCASGWTGLRSRARSRTHAPGAGILLPWFEPEITPPAPTPGVRRYGLAEGDAAADVRAARRRADDGDGAAFALDGRRRSTRSTPPAARPRTGRFCRRWPTSSAPRCGSWRWRIQRRWVRRCAPRTPI